MILYLEGITSEEDGNIVTNNVKVSLSSIEFDGEASGISQSLRTPTFVYDGRKSNDHRRLNTRCSQEVGAGEIRNIVGNLKKSLGRCSSCVYNSFRNPLSVKRRKLLYEMIILQQNWT